MDIKEPLIGVVLIMDGAVALYRQTAGKDAITEGGPNGGASSMQ